MELGFFSPLYQNTPSVVSLAMGPTSLHWLGYRLVVLQPLHYCFRLCVSSSSLPCVSCCCSLVLFCYSLFCSFHSFILYRNNVGSLGLLHFILLGWSYWLLMSSFLFLIRFSWMTLSGLTSSIPFWEFSRTILILKGGPSRCGCLPYAALILKRANGLAWALSTILQGYSIRLGHVCILFRLLGHDPIAFLFHFLIPFLS